MTRDQAFGAAKTAMLKDWRTRHPERKIEPNADAIYELLVFLEAIGLIKFDEPKTEREKLQDELHRVSFELEPRFMEGISPRGGGLTLYSAIGILDAIEQAGFKIVRAP